MNRPAIRALIVDDESLARRGVRVCLAGATDVEVIGECASGEEAVGEIIRLAPELVFLDVQMPGLDGFGVLARLPRERWPLVIFFTAHEQHAVRAFEAHALDYLLKPVDDDRFAVALGRARQRIQERSAGEVLTRMGVMLQTLPDSTAATRAGYLERFSVKSGARTVFVPVDEVIWISAEGDYAALHVLAGREHLIRASLNELEGKLDPRKFVRVHRSTIVSKNQVREVHALSSRDYLLRLHGGGELRMSRHFRDRFALEMSD